MSVKPRSFFVHSYKSTSGESEQKLTTELIHCVVWLYKKIGTTKYTFSKKVFGSKLYARSIDSPTSTHNGTDIFYCVVHNHPSGDPTPSPEDIAVTRQLVEAGELLDVDVLDHLVIGQGRWVSLREKRLGFTR